MPKFNYAELEAFFKSASEREVEALASQHTRYTWQKDDFDKWVASSFDYSDDKMGFGVDRFKKAKIYMAYEITFNKQQKLFAEQRKQKEREEQEKKDAEKRRLRQVEEELLNRHKPKEDDFYNTPEGRRVRMARELAEIEKNRDHADDARIDAMMRILSDIQK